MPAPYQRRRTCPLLNRRQRKREWTPRRRLSRRRSWRRESLPAALIHEGWLDRASRHCSAFLAEGNARLADGWEIRVTKISAEFPLEQWREKNPEAIVIADLGPHGTLRLRGPEDKVKDTEGTRLVVVAPKRQERGPTSGNSPRSQTSRHGVTSCGEAG